MPDLSEQSQLIVLNEKEGRIVKPRFSYLRDLFLGLILFAVFLGLITAVVNADYSRLQKRLVAFANPDGFVGEQKVPVQWLDRYNLPAGTEEDFAQDADGDGLSLYDEYVYLTSPLNPDTDGDGVSDGEEVKKGANPLGEGELSTNKSELLSRWEKMRENTRFDIDLVKRLSAFFNPDGFLAARKIPEQWRARYLSAWGSDHDSDSDTDGDGLSLYQEYLYLTDPTRADTDGDGVSDGEEVEAETNPRGRGSEDKDGDGMPDKWEMTYGLNQFLDDRSADRDGDGLSNRWEYLYGLDPTVADTDGDGYDDLREIKGGYDPSVPGDVRMQAVIVIDKINVTVPMVWASSVREDDMQRYLKKGAVHYPRTAAPGQKGNSFVAAHSSNYAWVDGNYNEVFSRLNEVVPGDMIKVKVTLANGKTVEHLYKTVQQRITKPDDPWIFLKTDKAVLTLSTCWPLGTRQKRLVVKAELVEQ